MYSKQTLFFTCLLFTQLAPSTPVPADAHAEVQQRDSPQYVINTHEPNYNVTCKASDTACVMGVAGPSQKRDVNTEVPEYLEGEVPVEKRQYASNGIQAAAQDAGINNLPQQTLNSNSPSNSSSNSSELANGKCKASDTACVMGVRDAMPEPEVDPITDRIAQLQSELEAIKAKREQLVKRAPAPAPVPIPADKTSSSTSTITSTTSSSTSTTTSMTLTSTATKNSTSTSTDPYPRSTNAFGRVVCKASDTDCVLGITR